MKWEIAKIESTYLGTEDHGILTAMLQVSYGGSGQGVGGYGLDRFDKETRERVGTAYGMEFVRRTLKACGVDSWEKVKGRTVHVLKASDDYQAKVLGIAPLPTERGEEFLFADLAEQFSPEES